MAKDTVVIRFDVANPRANNIIGTQAGKEITRITNDIREAARATILDGYAQGKGPNDIALDLAGRIDPQTGRRVGGILGMTGPQTAAALNLRRRLLSGDPSEMRKVLDMALRDKRFDPTILKAIKEEKKLSVADVSRMFSRYVDNAVKLRGETVARTETGQAVHAAAHEAFEQTLEKTGYQKSDVYRVWRTVKDKKVRDTHEEMDGQTVYGLDTPFTSPSGDRLMHPLDASLGAGPGEIINCRCDEEINIDFAAPLVRKEQVKKAPVAGASTLAGVYDEQKTDEIRAVAYKVAEDLNFPKAKIMFSSDRYVFPLNGKMFTAAGTADLKTGFITMYPAATNKTGAAGVVAHEIGHIKYQKLVDDRDQESREIASLSAPALKRLLKADGTPRNKKVADRFSNYFAMQDIRLADLEASGGLTDYSRDWWQAVVNGVARAQDAIHETIAEMTRLEYETPGVLEMMIERRAGTVWGRLYRLILDNWNRK